MSETSPRRGPYIREWRKFRGLTLVQLGRRIGMDHSAISKIETGKRRYNQNTLQRLAEALETTPAELLNTDPTNLPRNSSHPAAASGMDLVALARDLSPRQRRILIEIIRLLRSL